MAETRMRKNLPPKSMILNDFERQNKNFIEFSYYYSLRQTFQERKSLEIDQDNLCIKFSALNVVLLRYISAVCVQGILSTWASNSDTPSKCAPYIGLSNASWCARPVTPASECRCNAIDASFYYHHRVECWLLGSMSLDWFRMDLHPTRTTVARSLCVN